LRQHLRQLGQEAAAVSKLGVYYGELNYAGLVRPSFLKQSQFNTIQNKVTMTKRSLLISFFLRRRSLALTMAGATLAPFMSFAQQYQETDQVSNAGGQGAKFVDPHLVNPWGIARSSTGAWWVSDEDRGVATLYNGEGIAVNAQGAPQPLVVTIPHAGQGEGGPTGVVFNGSSDFDVEAGKPAIFIFASFDGTISAWNPNVNPTVAIEKVKATPGSVLTGATIAEIRNQRFLFVADVHEGKIRVFDKNFHPVRNSPEPFEDARLPENFVPFNVQNIGGHLYVAFAQQNQAKNFVNLGPGLGAVEVFSPEGELLQRLETGPLLNAPWGVVLAPTDFGSFSHSVLVGQFGSGQILAFDAVTGRFQGQLRNQDNNIISIRGLWGLAFGAGNTNSGGANQLFFNAAATGGLHGFFAPVSGDLTQGNDQ
jgi:uncharacterized protein (TIGR03118 family)